MLGVLPLEAISDTYGEQEVFKEDGGRLVFVMREVQSFRLGGGAMTFLEGLIFILAGFGGLTIGLLIGMELFWRW